MTCQHCQTWVGDDDHRCPRCGRRVRAVPARIAASTFPIAASANAIAYDFAPTAGAAAPARARYAEPLQDNQTHAAQQRLFEQPVNPLRVIAMDSRTSPAEREAIRARAPKKQPKRTRHNDDQPSLDLFAPGLAPPHKAGSAFCRLQVAPFSVRSRAAALDTVICAAASAMVLALYWACGGQIVWDKHVLPFAALALLTVPLAYKILWSFAGRDSLGMQAAGLCLVDLDGKKPSVSRRYQRVVGTAISIAAAGIGVIWAFVDEDHLTWHDHISGTFPTAAAQD